MTGIDDYALKGMQLGRLSGISIGVHAIPDAFFLMHTGVGCKYKAASQIANHDWLQHPNRREGWTEVGDRALIKGSAGRIGPYARTWYSRRKPALMVMATASFLKMTGEDFDAAARSVAADLGCPFLTVPAEGFDGDLYEGYARLLLAVAGQIDWQSGPRAGKQVGIIGYFFDRYEADHAGNLQQIRFMLESVGLNLGPVMLSGRPFGELSEIGKCEHLVQFPVVDPVKGRLAETCSRELIETHLPIGIASTSRWLRQVARSASADETRVNGFIESQTRLVRSRTAPLKDRIRGARFAVFAETPIASGLCGLLDELGIEPVLVGLRDSSLGGLRRFKEDLAQTGCRPELDPEVLERPGLRVIRNRLADLIEKGRLNGIIGSSIELNLLKTLSAGEIHRLVSARAVEGDAMPFIGLELGFPSTDYHAFVPEPYMGFGGVVSFAGRLLQAGRQHTPSLWA